MKWAELKGEKVQWAKDEIRSMKRFFKSRNYIPKEKIISVNGSKVENLGGHLKKFPQEFKTDISLKMLGFDDVSPAILY
ncbi:hypothetical protein [Flavobacterium ginsenosidimutans]|uniref:Uncharacterized protein n=1 Tax=Flavobacterium ginsenosidimutans TaxID=687844 RepID=A0ABZ2Q8V3_9FLAO